MLISRSHNFLFIHVPKAAGSSVRESLAPYRPRPIARLLSGLLPGAGRCFYRSYPPHLSAAEVKQLLPPRVFEGAFKFAFVRNPWDRHVSLYHYLQTAEHHPRHQVVRELADFSEFVHWWERHATRKRTQLSLLTDDRGEILVDLVGRFERLDDDFATICDRVGVVASLPRVNASRRGDYRDYYDATTRRIVGDFFAPDIERFGYAF